jgi:hypothetical protein
MKFTSKPERLLDSSNADANEHLYNYIVAFNKDGALKSNIEKRHNILSNYLLAAVK